MESNAINIKTFPAIMRIQEASAFTGYSIRYLYRLTSEKRIPHYKPRGGRLIFKRDELEAFLLRGRVPANYELEAAADAILLSRPSR